MTGFPEPLQKLIAELGRLPGVGTRTAERIAFFVLKSDRADVERLAAALVEARGRLAPCRVCFNLTTTDVCPVCSDAKRDHAVVMVVEHPKDLAAFERVGRYQGVYHVLLGRVSPHEGFGPEHTAAQALVARIAGGGVREVIIATNPDAEGDTTALWLERLLKTTIVAVSRLARGLSTGGSIEYAGTEMLADALENRRPVLAPANGARP